MKQLTSTLKTKLQKLEAFTIIELLIVVGIIAILAVTLIALLNPAEAQKRTRDAKRLKDANTLQTIVSQFLEDGNSFTSACTTTTPCTSSGAVGDTVTSKDESTNWLGAGGTDLSIYAQGIPVDPFNATGTCVTGTGTTSTSCSIVYKVAVTNRNYEINVRMESLANDTRVTGDSGDSTQWFEIYNGPNDLMTN